MPGRRILCCGDLFIWATPNAGNPQKVQRYPRDWAGGAARDGRAGRRADAAGARTAAARRRPDPHRAVGHRGAARVDLRAVDRADERGRVAGRAAAERAGAGRAARTTLAAADLRRARIHRPQHLASLRRLVGRQPRPPEAGARRRARAASWPGSPAEPSGSRPAQGSWPGPASSGSRRTWPSWPRRPSRSSREAHEARAEVYERRAGEAESTMARGIFSWAAGESRRALEERGVSPGQIGAGVGALALTGLATWRLSTGHRGRAALGFLGALVLAPRGRRPRAAPFRTAGTRCATPATRSAAGPTR